jgi:broad specificity phosphatase PhoE
MSHPIYFVTHPEVVIDPAMPVPQWPLAERGRRRMRCLLSQDWMPHVAAIYCSTEQKAIDGATILSEALGMPFHPVVALGETDRSATGYLPKTEFEATADAFFARPRERIRGWERAIDAQARIRGAVEHLGAMTPGTGPIVIVSHGGGGDASALSSQRRVYLPYGRAARGSGGQLLSLPHARGPAGSRLEAD